LVDYDIIVLSETWLHNDINDNELGLLPTYSVFRSDRGSTFGTNINIRGGGVLIAVKSHLHCYSIPLQNNDVEQLFIKLSLGSFLLLIGAVYIPPKSDMNVYNSHTDTVNNLLTEYCNSKIIILGDYNLPGLHWSVVNNKNVPDSRKFSNLETNILANFSYLNLQ